MEDFYYTQTIEHLFAGMTCFFGFYYLACILSPASVAIITITQLLLYYYMWTLMSTRHKEDAVFL